MRRENITERLIEIAEELYQLRDVMNGISLRVDVLWEERKERQRKAAEEVLVHIRE